MKNIDILSLDGNTLKTFLAVMEEGSVTNAAIRLNLSQSAVSHTLDRLRKCFDDPLFIREGRGICPTAKAQAISQPIEAIVSDLGKLTVQKQFDPVTDSAEFAIATNDFPMGYIFPVLLKSLREQGITPKLHFIPAGIPSANLTRASDCHMMITPAPPNNNDLIAEPLIKAKMVCFYDASSGKPPRTRKQYFDSDYVDVRFSNTETSNMVLPLNIRSKLKEASVAVPNFNAVTQFIKGTDLITTQLQVMKYGCLSELDWSPLPVKTQALSLYLVWHKRHNDDQAHRWFRECIFNTVNSFV